MIGLTLAFYYFKMIVAGILKLWLKLTKDRFCGKRFYKILTKNLFFNDILGLSLEAYIEFLIDIRFFRYLRHIKVLQDLFSIQMYFYISFSSLCFSNYILRWILIKLFEFRDRNTHNLHKFIMKDTTYF